MQLAIVPMQSSGPAKVSRALALFFRKDTFYLVPGWDFRFPDSWAVAVALLHCKGGAGTQWYATGWGWMEGEPRIRLVPNYGWMPDKSKGKTLSWLGFFFQHQAHEDP